jgi:hypothetical protein
MEKKDKEMALYMDFLISIEKMIDSKKFDKLGIDEIILGLMYQIRVYSCFQFDHYDDMEEYLMGLLKKDLKKLREG